MGFFQNLLKQRKEREMQARAYEDQQKMVAGFEQRQLSHNERELMKVLEKQRQEDIRRALACEERRRIADEKLRARQMMSFNSGMFNGNSHLMKNNINFLTGGGF